MPLISSRSSWQHAFNYTRPFTWLSKPFTPSYEPTIRACWILQDLEIGLPSRGFRGGSPAAAVSSQAALSLSSRSANSVERSAFCQTRGSSRGSLSTRSSTNSQCLHVLPLAASGQVQLQGHARNGCRAQEGCAPPERQTRCKTTNDQLASRAHNKPHRYYRRKMVKDSEELVKGPT